VAMQAAGTARPMVRGKVAKGLTLAKTQRTRRKLLWLSLTRAHRAAHGRRTVPWSATGAAGTARPMACVEKIFLSPRRKVAKEKILKGFPGVLCVSARGPLLISNSLGIKEQPHRAARGRRTVPWTGRGGGHGPPYGLWRKAFLSPRRKAAKEKIRKGFPGVLCASARGSVLISNSLEIKEPAP